MSIYLTKLEFTNWQKHAHLIINLKEGVNCIYGESGTGKSCIRRGIEFLLGESFTKGRKEGTKQTSVKGWFSNGVILERIRSTSINRYIFNNGKGSVSTFDAVGKETPDEIKTLLPLYPIEIDDEKVNLNFSSQISLPFLFDKSPTTRMKLFNKLSGNEIIDKLFVQFNKDILVMNRNLREGKEQLIIQEKNVNEKEIEKEQIEYKYQKAQKTFKTVEELNIKYSNLLILQELLQKQTNDSEKLSSDLLSIKVPELQQLETLRKNIDDFNKKTALFEALNTFENQLSIVEANLNKQSDISSVNLMDLRANIDRFTTLNSILEEFEINETSLLKILDLEKSYNVTNIDLKMLQEQIEKIEKVQRILTKLDEYDTLLKDIQLQDIELNLKLKELELEKSKFQVCDKCNGSGVLINE